MGEQVLEQLLGPLAALALALVLLGAFYTGRVLSRNAVPREDYDKIVDINATQAEGLKVVTASLNELVVVVRAAQKDGGL